MSFPSDISVYRLDGLDTLGGIMLNNFNVSPLASLSLRDRFDYFVSAARHSKINMGMLILRSIVSTSRFGSMLSLSEPSGAAEFSSVNKLGP